MLLTRRAMSRALLIMTLLSSCGPTYGGPRCRAITLDTDRSELPLGPVVAAEPRDFHQSDPFITGTPELGCCVRNPYFTQPSDCSAVNCDELNARLTKANVNFRTEEPCGRQDSPFVPPGGGGVCSVFLEGNKVVGVRAFCFD